MKNEPLSGASYFIMMVMIVALAVIGMITIYKWSFWMALALLLVISLCLTAIRKKM